MEAREVVAVAGEREPYWIGGGVIDIRLDSAATGGAFALLDIVNQPGGGIPTHVHERDDETVVQLEGELAATIGGEARTLRPGDVVHIPRGVVHSFLNEGVGPTRTLAIVTPGGGEQMIREAGIRKTGAEPPAAALAPPDLAALAAAAARVGLSFAVEAKHTSA